MVGRRQHVWPSRSRRGSASPRSWSVRTTRTAVRRWRKVSNTRAIRACTSRSGLLVTTPEASRTSPTGNGKASSPRSALASRPAVRQAADRVQLQFRDRAFQPKQQPAVRRARIIDAVAVGDQAFAMPAHVEQRIPVGTVAGQARDVDRENEAHLAQGHPGHKVLETAAVIARRAARAEIAVDHLNVSLMPAERAGAAVQRVLQTKALLVGQHLMRGRLANIDYRPPLQMMRLYEFRGHRSPPGARRQGCPRPPYAGWAASFARRRRGRPAFSLTLRRHPQQILQPLKAQLCRHTARGGRVQARYRDRKKQKYVGAIHDSCELSRAHAARYPQQPEPPPIERVPRIGDLDLLRSRKIAVSNRGISVGGRWKASTGECHCAPGARKLPAEGGV